MLRARLRHYAKRLFGKPSVPPPVNGVADAGFYFLMDGVRNQQQ